MKKPARMKWTIIGDIMVSYITSGVMPDDVWDRFCNDFAKSLFTKSLTSSLRSYEINSVQRKKIADLANQKKVRTAMVTDDKVVRGLVTAVSWLGADIKAFSWGELRDAVQHLGATPENADRIVSTVTQFKLELGE